MTDNVQSDWETLEDHAGDVAQAKALREQASKGGLRFEAYLPPGLAGWILDLVERGIFVDPGEAVFVILGEHRDLEPHADLRQELLNRSLEAAMNDPRPLISSEDLHAEMDALMNEPRPDAAVWMKRASL